MRSVLLFVVMFAFMCMVTNAASAGILFNKNCAGCSKGACVTVPACAVVVELPTCPPAKVVKKVVKTTTVVTKEHRVTRVRKVFRVRKVLGKLREARPVRRLLGRLLCHK